MCGQTGLATVIKSALKPTLHTRESIKSSGKSGRRTGQAGALWQTGNRQRRGESVICLGDARQRRKEATASESPAEWVSLPSLRTDTNVRHQRANKRWELHAASSTSETMDSQEANIFGKESHGRENSARATQTCFISYCRRKLTHATTEKFSAILWHYTLLCRRTLC